MNENERLRRMAAECRLNYPPGTRIMLLSMNDDPDPVEENMKGTVDVVDSTGTLHCTFDNGRCLGVIPGQDSFRKLTQEELAEEQAQEETTDEDEVPAMAPSM